MTPSAGSTGPKKFRCRDIGWRAVERERGWSIRRRRSLASAAWPRSAAMSAAVLPSAERAVGAGADQRVAELPCCSPATPPPTQRSRGCPPHRGVGPGRDQRRDDIRVAASGDGGVQRLVLPWRCWKYRAVIGPGRQRSAVASGRPSRGGEVQRRPAVRAAQREVGAGIAVQFGCIAHRRRPMRSGA
ncbi:MAG: hypothetical protein U1F24_03855 [Alphaproteobacteria bacterium]